MSKARLVIIAVVVEGRSQADIARAYGVSPSWVSKPITRYRTEGDAALEPRSRRPHTSPQRHPTTGRGPDREPAPRPDRTRHGRGPPHHRLAPTPPPQRHRVPRLRSPAT
ncbi:helix-turn-helix domain-containing protein [Nocardia neocaledoniensis]|uniref:helix-turn-helix domain-containing protein n=1 Tax=Nocardia neocaledoniensis TaxID=236511 RepID=UPI003D796C6C